jgi:hypothetical protein
MVGPLVRARRLAAAFSLPLILGTCTEGGTGPSAHRAALAVTTTLPAAADLASFNLVIDNVRLIVVRPPAETLFEQVVAFPASQTSLQLSATVDLQQDQETLDVTIQLLSGSQVLFSGTQSLQVTSGPTPAPAVIPVVYAGPGSNVASLTIDPQDSVLSFGGTMTFRLTGRDAQNNIVPSFYVSWTTSDTNVAKIDATGHLTAPLVRGTFNVRAYTWDSVTTATPITFAPVATQIIALSGCNQTGLPGVQLPQPVLVKVIAGDGLGVKGVTVQFTNPPGGSVTPAQAETDGLGLVQAVVTLGTTPGSASFSISASGLTSVTCNQTVQTSATKLVFTQPPDTGPIVAGAPFTLIVVAQDALGNAATDFTGTVTLDIGANPGGITFVPRTVAAVAGVALFGNVTIDKVGIGYTLVASSGTLTAATTGPFNVGPAAPAQLVFSVQPSTVGAGSPMLPPVVVAAQDAFGNPTPSFVANVTIAIGTNPSNGVLGGVLIQPAIAGVATFAALTIDKIGGGYTLVASSPGLTDGVSTAFNVTTVPATQLAFTTQPSNVTAGSAIGPPIVVTAVDSLGNPDLSFTGVVTIAIGSNPSGGLLGGTATTNAIAGVATFGTLSINKSGAGYTLVATAAGVTGATSTAFNVNAGAATQLAFTQQPPVSLVAGTSFTIVVTAQDNLGNTATAFAGNITLAFGSHPLGSVLTGTTSVNAVGGVATFSNLGALTVAGGYTLVASSTGFQSVVSNSFTVTPAAATALAFITQPSAVTAGAVMSPAVQVAVQDAFGNTVTSATNAITLSLTVAGGATLGGTLTRNAASGIATFTGLTVDLAGPYTLSAVASGLTGATSVVFNVTSGTVASLLVAVAPSVDTAGATRSITVTARDLNGNTVTGYTGTVVFTSSDPQALLPSNYTFTAGDNGVHSFTGGASLRTVGSQSVTATDIANTLITGSQLLSVTPGTAAALFFTVQPVTVSVGAAITPPVQVTARDGFSNTATGFTGSVTVGIGNNPGGAALGGTNTVNAAAGVATFPGLTLNQAGSGYTLTAAASGLTGATSAAFDISLVGAAPNAWSNPIGGAWSVPTNWSLGRVPQATDSVVIALNGTYTVTLDTTISMAFLTFGGSSGVQTLAMSTRTLTVTNAVTVQVGATATVNNGTIAGSAALTNLGSLTLGSTTIASAFTNQGTLVATGTSQLSGPLTTTAGDSIIVRGNGTFGAGVLTTSGGNWTNNGAIVLTDVTSSYGATLTVSGGATLTNAPAATIDATLGTSGDRTINAVLVNQGTLTVGAAAARKLTLSPPAGAALTNNGTVAITGGTLQVTLSGTSPTFTNAGGIDLTGGNFSINQPSGGAAGTLALSATGQIAIGAARTMTVTGGGLTVPTGATLTGTGNLALSGATANVTPDFNTSLTGLSLFNSTWGGAGTLTNPSGKTLNLQASSITAPFVNGGTLLATGTSQIAGSFMTQSGDSVIVQGNGTFGAGVLTTSGGSWTNNGAIVLTDVVSSYGATLTVPTGTLTNPVGSTIEALLGTNGDRSLNATLINQGTVTVGVAAARKLQITPPGGSGSSNSATITINSGLLQITQSGASPSFTNSGTIQLVGGDFSLSQPSGVTPGTLSSGGTLSIGSARTLTVTGGGLTILGGANIIGTGTLSLSGTTANVTPNFNTSLTGLTLLNSTWNGPGTLTNPAGKSLNLQSSTVTAPLVNAGTLLATGTSQITGSFTTQSGDSLVVQGNGTFGAGVLTVSGGSWTNNGAIVLTDIVSSYGATLTVPSGTLTNPAGGTIDAPLGTSGDRSLNATLINQGTVTVGVAAARKLQITPPGGTASSNSTTITINSGLLQITQSGTNPSFTNSGTIQLVGGSFSLGQPSGAAQGTLTSGGTISIASGRTVTVTGGVLTIPSGAIITGTGTLSLSGATANVTPNFNTSLTGLTLLNSTWNGPGTLTNPLGKTLNLQASTITAPFVNGGTMLATGTSALTGTVTTGVGDSIIVQGNGTFGTAVLTVSGDLINNGAIVLTDIVSSYGATLTLPTGTLTNPTLATIEAPLGTGGDRTINAIVDNQGTITVGTAAARKLTIAPPGGGEINNSGSIAVNSGTLQASLTGTNPFASNSGSITLTGGDFALTQPSGASAGLLATPGTLVIGSSRTFSVTGGGFQVPLGGVISGAGTLALSSDSAAVTPDFNTGSTRLSLLNSVWLGSGSLTNASGVTLNLQNSEINAAFDNQGTLVATGTSVLSGSATTTSSSVIQVQGNGTFGGATLHVTTFSGLTNNGTINLTEVVSGYGSTLIVDNGLINASGGQLQTFTGFLGPRTLTADLTNNSGATVTIARTLTLNQPAGTHSNAGLIQLVGGDLIVQFSSGRPGISNTGLIDVGTNTMKVFGPASAFVNQAGGTLQGSGTFDVTGTSFITDGTTVVGSSPGILKFVGPYIQGPSPSVLKVEIGGSGASPGTAYDQLQASDNVQIQGGTLDVTQIAPVAGQIYTIITVPAGKTITGDFQSKIGLGAQCTGSVSGTAYVIAC